MGRVTLSGLRKTFGPVEVVKGVTLDIADGELVVFVGPSGCGKSTLLRMIAGLEDVDSGSIEIAGRDVTDLPPAKRGLAMVFQSYALYPHMSAFDNMAYGLRRAGSAKAEVNDRVTAVARLLQIEHLLDRRPKAMSGGQRQRIAIGRAIVRNPDVFLFDEPLSNLDATLRVETRAQIAKLHRDLKATMIFVTHDQVEAMTLADRIVVLRAGVVEQVGTSREVYHKPANLFVAGFIGSPAMNFVEATAVARDENDVTLLINGKTRRVGGTFTNVEAESPVTLGLRPDHLIITSNQHALFTVEILLVEHLGNETLFHAVTDTGKNLLFRLGGDTSIAVGDKINLDFEPTKAHVFGANGQNLAL
jgi:multiple sugar transport system ATP-binding protein